MDKLKRLMMEKKKSKKLSKNEIDAKSSVLNHLSDTASEMMKERLGGLKKATIMADSSEGMKKGAELVQKIAKSMPNGEDSKKSGMEEAKDEEQEMVADAEDGEGMEMGEESAEESAEEAGEEKTKEELLAELERLKAKIEKMS